MPKLISFTQAVAWAFGWLKSAVADKVNEAVEPHARTALGRFADSAKAELTRQTEHPVWYMLTLGFAAPVVAATSYFVTGSHSPWIAVASSVAPASLLAARALATRGNRTRSYDGDGSYLGLRWAYAVRDGKLEGHPVALCPRCGIEFGFSRTLEAISGHVGHAQFVRIECDNSECGYVLTTGRPMTTPQFLSLARRQIEAELRKK